VRGEFPPCSRHAVSEGKCACNMIGAKTLLRSGRAFRFRVDEVQGNLTT